MTHTVLLLRLSTTIVCLGLAGCAGSPGPELATSMAPVPQSDAAVAMATSSSDRAGLITETVMTAAPVSFQAEMVGGAQQGDDSVVVPPTPERAYSRQQAPTEAGNRFLPPPEIPPAPSVSWSDLESLTSPVPLTLAAAEALACQHNPTLLQARAQVEGNIGKAIQAGLWPNPTLVYSAEQIGVDETAGEFHGTVVRQRIVTGRKLDLSREKYLARSRVAQWVALAQQYRVLNDVRIQYFRARGRQELLDVQRQLLKNAEDQVVTFREMYNVGQATRPELHQANISLQQQRLVLLMAENEFRQSREELIALVGIDVPVSGLETPLAGDLALISWDEALYRLIEESPQVAAARSKLEAERLTIRREIAEPVPDIIVQGGAGYNFVADQTVGVAQLMMEVPLFDWNQGTIRQAEADYARQQGEVRRIERLLRQQLAQQYRHYVTAVQHIRNYQQVILPEAKLAYDLRLQAYEVDRGPWTDVLEAERDYFGHRAQYISNLIDWREHEVRIMGFLLTGSLEQPPVVGPPGHLDATPQPR